jgi:hypothetical protein
MAGPVAGAAIARTFMAALASGLVAPGLHAQLEKVTDLPPEEDDALLNRAPEWSSTLWREPHMMRRPGAMMG